MALPPSTQLAYVQAARPIPPPPGFDYSKLNFQRRDIWFQNSVRGSDQLRQRVAWALSQILVTSQVSLANRYPMGLADYYDTLARHAFGDFRQLMEAVTLHPMMGVYLSMLGNRKPNAELNIRPDENYARELMQLFTIGLVELDADGTPKLDAHDQPIPTYDQAVVEGFAHVFTGWHWACTFGSPADCGFSNTRGTVPNQILPMQLFPEEHDTGEKRLLTYPNAVKSVVPAGQTAEQDLADALDNIFHHPNVGPFIARQLIQRLVTSNPSPAYVARVSAVFDDDGTGQRGNLGAVVRAILLDAEARAPASTADPGASKLKEPVLRITQLWRAYDGRAANDRYFNIDPAVDFGQGPLQAPSVFNFYSPFYAPPGEISDLGLVAPELQIATEYQNALVTNYFYTQIFFRNSTNQRHERERGGHRHRRGGGARRRPGRAGREDRRETAREPDLGHPARPGGAAGRAGPVVGGYGARRRSALADIDVAGIQQYVFFFVVYFVQLRALFSSMKNDARRFINLLRPDDSIAVVAFAR